LGSFLLTPSKYLRTTFSMAAASAGVGGDDDDDDDDDDAAADVVLSTENAWTLHAWAQSANVTKTNVAYIFEWGIV